MTESAGDLLIVALQDLYAAEQILLDRLGDVADAASDERLIATIQGYRRASRARGETVASLIDGLGAPAEAAPNIWMKDVLDDAARDAATIVAGPLRDIALAGALRKGAQAARVSYETAIELAHTGEICRASSEARDAHAAVDADLMRALVRLAAPESS